MASTAIAQGDDQYDAVALRMYYSDLYLAFAQYEIDDVPFHQRRVKVRHNDTLLKLAKRHPVAKLDSLHLAAALYNANPSLFNDSGIAQLSVGATLTMPSVGDIFYAQDRYEKLKLVGSVLNFANEDNQMRSGLRRPSVSSESMIGPLTGNEPLRNRDFTLPSYRVDSNTHDKNKAASGFVSRAIKQDPEKSKNTVASGVNTVKAVAVVDSAPAVGGSLEGIGRPGVDTNTGLSGNSTMSLLGNETTDPLSSIVEWKFDDGASLGVVLNRLAEYVGYELITTDEIVLDTYNRQLPALQRSISGITAEEGFILLAGRGLETVFDHVTRAVKHTPKTKIGSTKMVDNAGSSTAHERFIQASGISAMVQQLPTDILIAAERHASRCDSSVSTRPLDAARLYQVVVGKFKKTAPESAVINLVDWYESPTGLEVLRLENQQIDDAGLQRFSMDSARADRIKMIYDITVTGMGIASIAVALDYAGWSVSGCKQKAEISGKIDQEMAYGQGIKNKLSKLESLLREDMLPSLAYQFSSLSERQLTEYADVTLEHAGVYSGLEQSIVDAIELETKVTTLSSLD